MWTVLRQRNFGLLWLAGFLALSGTWAFYAAMPIYILDQTGSVFYSGAVWTLIAVPGIVIGPAAGVWVDRWDRRRVMLWCNIAQAISASFLLVVGGSHGVAIATAVLLAQAIITSLFSPAENALLPTVVSDEDLQTANALNSLNDGLARIAGPFIGAVLYAWIDIRGAALVNVIAFLVAAGLISLVLAPGTPPKSDDHEHESTMQSLRVAIGYIRNSRLLTVLFLVAALSGIADAPLTAALASFIRNTLDRSAADFGLFLSLRGVAGIAGGLVIGQIASRFRMDRLLIASLFILAIEIAFIAIARDFWVFVGLMLVVGPVFAAMATAFPTLLQRGSQDAWRGRLFALYGAMAGIIFAVSSLAGSVIAAAFSPTASVALSAGLYLVAAIVALWLLPAAVAHNQLPSQDSVDAH